MAKIVTTTESGDFGVPRLQHDPRTHGGALTVAASQIARNIGAKALVAFSQTGDTVRRLARLHCDLPLLAFTPVAEVRDQLALSWGVETFLTAFVQHTDDMFRQVDQALLGLGLAKPGDYVVVVAGSPPNAPGSTNTLRVHQLGSLVRRGGRDSDAPLTAPPPTARPSSARPRSTSCSRSSTSSSRPGDLPGQSPQVGAQRVFGGQVAGQALVAAGRTVDPDRFVHSLHGYFVRPGDPAEPIEYQVENIRDGRSFSVRRSVAQQHGKTIFFMSASFQVREEGLDHHAPAPLDVPGPDEVPTMTDRLARYPERLGHLAAAPAGRRRALRRRARLGPPGRPRPPTSTSGSGCASTASCPTIR